MQHFSTIFFSHGTLLSKEKFILILDLVTHFLSGKCYFLMKVQAVTIEKMIFIKYN